MPKNCIHCGTPLDTSQKGSDFCCTGCEFVHQLIHEQGLEKFYDLKRDETTAPLRDQPFQQQDFSWLEEEMAQREQNDPENTTREFHGSLQGISCIGCVWLVERLFMRREGAIRCDIIPTTGSIQLTWQRNQCDIIEVAHELQQFGYLLGKARSGSARSGQFRQLGVKLGVCGAFAMNAMAFSLPRYLGMPDDFAFAGIFELIAFLSATLAMLVGGSWFIKRAYHGLKSGILHMDTPIALGVSLAYAGSVAGWMWQYEDLLYFDFVAIFIFLMLGGRWLQTVAVEHNRNRLLEQTPVPNKVKSPDDSESIETHDLKEGTTYMLPPGQTTPVTSVITRQAADFSLEWISGEPDPIHQTEGTSVPAGALNLGNIATEMRAEENWNDSLLAKLIQATETTTRSPRMEKILRYYLIIVFLLGSGGAIVWSITGNPIQTSLQVAISVFVISCPCALGVALPLADELASGKMRILGVFIRKPSFWNRLRQIKTLFFDKTGTLTNELPELINPDAIHHLGEHDKLVLAVLSSHSRHPMSRSIMRSMGMTGQQLATSKHTITCEEVPGLGTKASDEKGQTWSLGKYGWDGISDVSHEAEAAGCEFRHNQSPLSHFTFREALRPDSSRTLQRLKGKNIHILSGDHADRVQHIAEQLGLDTNQVHSGLDPEDKATLVSKIDPETGLFLGDGANDSLAFDAAGMSGAVAGRGLLESKADFYFLSSGLDFLPRMFQLANQHSHTVLYVFIFSVLYNLVAITFCLAGTMNPLLAAILMPISSVVSLAIVSISLRSNNRANLSA